MQIFICKCATISITIFIPTHLLTPPCRKADSYVYFGTSTLVSYEPIENAKQHNFNKGLKNLKFRLISLGEKYHWGTHDVKITISSIESNSKNARFSEMPWFNAQFACDGKEVTKSSVDCAFV